MAEPIRLLHFADLHVGMENYGKLDPNTGTSSRVRDFLDRLDEVVDYAVEHGADLAVFAGDAFKNRDPNPTHQREFARRVKRLADHMPTLLVVGNHDMPGMAAKANTLDIFRALEVPGVMVGHKPEGRVVETRSGPVYLAWIPYPMRNRLLDREEHHGKSIEELEMSLRQTVTEIHEHLKGQAEGQDMPRVLAGHLTVEGAVYGSERSVMLGRDVAVLTSTLKDPAWDYVALGHIHRHQAVGGPEDPPVVYSGSLERIDFGEEKEPKGFCWVELSRGSSRWEFIQVQARPFHTLKVDVRHQEDPTAHLLSTLEPEALEEAVVRLQVRLRHDQEPLLREGALQEAFAGAAAFVLEKEVELESRIRLGDLSPEALTPLELLERYYQSREQPPERIEALLDIAEGLLNE